VGWKVRSRITTKGTKITKKIEGKGLDVRAMEDGELRSGVATGSEEI
jgi:hypothetical protein